MVRLGLWGASLVVAVAVGCGGGSGGGGAAGTINVDTGGAGGNSASTGEAGGPGGATAGAGGATAGAGAGGKGGAGGRGSSSATLAGTLTVTLDGAAVSYPSIIGGFNGLRVDISGYSADLTRSFAFSVYPNGMAAGSFTCALGGPTSMTMSYSVNFSPMNAAATTAGCMGTFTMIPTSADAGGRFVGTFSGTVGTVAATAGMVDVTLPPN